MNSTIKNNQTRIRDFILVYLVIGFSVIPFFSSNTDLLTFLTIILFLYVIIYYKINFDTHLIIILVLLILMYIGQFITLEINQPNFRSIFGTFIRFLFPFIVLSIVGSKFLDTFVKVVYILTIIGLILWGLENILPSFSNVIHSISLNLKLDIESNENILIYNTEGHWEYGLIRNAGFAFEGGAYSIILIIAIIFNLLMKKYQLDKQTIIFIIAIITTFSTAGYLALGIVFFGLYYTKIKNKLQLILFSILFLTFVIYAFTELDFLEEKIVRQIDIARDPNATAGRFASAAADILEWQRNPIFGVGKSDETRFSIFRYGNQHRVNGLASFLAIFGVVIFFTYLFLMWNSLKKINMHYLVTSKFVVFQFFAIIGLAFSQNCLQWSVFITIPYLSMLIKNNKKYEKKHNLYLP